MPISERKRHHFKHCAACRLRYERQIADEEAAGAKAAADAAEAEAAAEAKEQSEEDRALLDESKRHVAEMIVETIQQQAAEGAREKEEEQRGQELARSVDRALDLGHTGLWEKLEFVAREAGRIKRDAEAKDAAGAEGEEEGATGTGRGPPHSPREDDHSQRHAIAQAMQAVRRAQANRFVVAVDGSDGAHKAFETVMNMRMRNDQIDMLHVFDPDKEPVSPHFHPDAIMERYDVELVSRILPNYYSFHWERKKAGTSTKAAICHYVNDHVKYAEEKPTWFVSGIVGRKGPKEDPSCLGSVADLALRSIHIPCVIVKRAISTSDPVTFVMAVDYSQLSRDGFDMLLSFVRKRDKLIVLHVTDDDSQLTLREMYRAGPVQEYYENEFLDKGPVDCTFRVLRMRPTETVHETILEFVDVEGADFVCIAPRAKERMSSLTERLIGQCHANVVLLKN